MPVAVRRLPALAASALIAGLLALGPGQPAPSLASNHIAVANVTGTVWYDEAGTGQHDGRAVPAAGAWLTVHPDPGLPPIYANAEGAFAFSIPEGSYTVEAWWYDPQAGGTGAVELKGAYTAAQRRFIGGTNQELHLGVRPTSRFPARVDAKVHLVWTHDAIGQARSVAEAPLANVVALLYHAGTSYSVPCGYSPRVALVVDVNGQSMRLEREGMKRIVTAEGRTFPVWEFNDVDVKPALSPGAWVHFSLQVSDDFTAAEGEVAATRFRSNRWVHSLDSAQAPSRELPSISAADCQ